MKLFRSAKTSGSGQLGLCFEPAGVSFAQVQLRKNEVPRLLGCELIALEEPASQTAIEQLVRQRRLKGSRTVLVLPPEHYQVLQVEMADLPDEERREASRWQIRELINYPAGEAVVDLYDVAPYSSEKRPLTYVVAARQSALRSQVARVAGAGLHLSAIDIPEFTLRNIADLYSEGSHGVALLHLQEYHGLLVISREGILYLTRSFPIGMSQLSSCAPDDTEGLTEQLDSIVLEIQRSFDYCESIFHLPTVSKLLVAQTLTEIPTIINYLDNLLAPQVESLNFDGVMELPEGCEQLQLNRKLSAIGAALRREGD